MTYEEMIMVLEAAKEGAKIQVRSHISNKWEPTDKPMWDFAEFDYRVAPAPREFYLAQQATGEFVTFETRHEAARLGWSKGELIHVREIL